MSGILKDVRARLKWYPDDWKQGFDAGYRILAPSTYIFFASVIPALAFGEQIAEETDNAFNGVQVLISTGVFGMLQAVIGGQPLLIVGVAEPTVLIYVFLYRFVKDKEDVGFLPFTSWVCVWAGGFMIVLAAMNACNFIDRFTRFSGEVFGMLIAVLFMQQAIKGLTLEFQGEGAGGHRRLLSEEASEAEAYSWRLANGLWGVMLGVGLLFTSMLLLRARSWRFGKGWMRSFLADYGVPLMVVVWSGVSYAISTFPEGLPRRLSIPSIYELTAEQTKSYSVFVDMADIPVEYIFIAIVPALIILGLEYFDHNVSAQLAQQKEFNLAKPPAYNYDFFLLGWCFVACGLVGLPPINGVIPQAPMHTKSLATLKRMLIKRDLNRQSMARQSMQSVHMSVNVEVDGKPALGRASMPLVDKKPKPNGVPQMNLARNSMPLITGGAKRPPRPDGRAATRRASDGSSTSGAPRSPAAPGQGEVLPLSVKEQRLSGLLQSLMVLACLPLTPVIRLIPKGVLWGYFAYMALESLPGSEFWDRILLIFTDIKARRAMLTQSHMPYLETVPFNQIMRFTVFQLVCFFVCWGITWAGVAGVAFPVAICALVPFRQYVMPKMFAAAHLAELDCAEYEEAPPLDPASAIEIVLLGHADARPSLEKPDPEHEIILRETTGGLMSQPVHHLSPDTMRRRKSGAIAEEVAAAAAAGV